MDEVQTIPAKEGKFKKVCLFCRKHFSSDSRNTRFCQDNEGVCQQKYSKSKKAARAEYRLNADRERTKVLAHKLAVAVLDLNGVPRECVITGEKEEIEAHHKNVDIYDNRLANLCWLSKKMHAKLHSLIIQRNKEQIDSDPVKCLDLLIYLEKNRILVPDEFAETTLRKELEKDQTMKSPVEAFTEEENAQQGSAVESSVPPEAVPQEENAMDQETFKRMQEVSGVQQNESLIGG